MDIAAAQIFELSREAESVGAGEREKSAFLAWASGNPHFSTRAGLTTYELDGAKLFRRSATALWNGKESVGTGSSFVQDEAALIAAMELVERIAARSAFENRAESRNEIEIDEAEIKIYPAHTVGLPSRGFWSTNGWAAHFSLSAAIAGAVREALERHILLYTFLKHGWNGFAFGGTEMFFEKRLVRGLACARFAGRFAGVSCLGSSVFPGCAFGYTVGDGSEEGSEKIWFRAKLEAFYQLDDEEKFGHGSGGTWLERAKNHYLKESRFSFANQPAALEQIPSLKARIATFDMAKAFGLSFPLFAAFVFGSDLIPLFHSGKLASEETGTLRKVLSRWEIEGELPEVHPIL